jgi:hypothetical protein
MRWWHGVGCPSQCPSVICQEKEWAYKDLVFRDQTRCALNAQSVCGCPSLGDPVVHHKPIRVPQGTGTIEIELIPLSLQSCMPVNP